MTAAAERQMVQNVLIHELDVGIAQFNASIGVPEWKWKHNKRKQYWDKPYDYSTISIFN